MRLYTKFSDYLKEKFNCRVHKISVYAGFYCPNLDGTLSNKGCIYCNNYAFSPCLKDNLPLVEQIKRGIEYGKKRFKAEKFIVYFQPYSNTYATVEILREKYDIIKKFPEVIGISIGTRPDCIDEEKLNLIESYSENYEVWIEYGLQSIHNKTLKIINRNHTYSDFLKAVDLTRKRNIKICVHVIIGLPGETKEEIIKTSKECGRLKLDGIKIHPIHILKNTELEKWYKEGKFKVMNMEEYIEILIDFLSFLYHGTIIQRLTADCDEKFLVAPSWLLQKQKMLKLLEEKMKEKNMYQGKNFKEE
ncbi:MAG: TIGR01212 family radical SAM protein [bacterium]|nr:TIGR01212 family radical SAM protein [bacterium]MDW8163850.1 TIGR01212 family radical SAM protein [Candidatus Omnitrophota bacterium]